MTQPADASRPAGPLSGLRILDLTRILAGPTCTQLLADMGADVVKVERPGKGDDTRSWGPPYLEGAAGPIEGMSAYFMCANRNKRSIAVDMASPGGARLLQELAGQADVVIENFRPGSLAKYGLDHETLRRRHSHLVYCSISGFGQTGPNAHRPGYDLLAQAYGGIMSLTGEPEGEPMKVGVGIADVVCGLYAAVSILAALRHRDATGEGQHIDVSLIDTQISWLINEGVNYLTSGEAPKRRGNQHPNIVPYQLFEAADGPVIVAVGNDGQFARFCAIFGREDLAEDPRYATNPARLEHREELIALLADLIAAMPRAALLEAMEAAGVPGGAVNTVPEVFATRQVAAREMKISMEHPQAASGKVDLIGNPVKFSATPVSYRRVPPNLGADHDEVLRDWLGKGKGERPEGA